MRVMTVTGAVAALALTGTGLAVASQYGQGPAIAAASLTKATAVGPAAADRAATAYVRTRHPGPGGIRVLATEPDTERGVAVYDVRVLAPDRAIYVVHVQRATGRVLWANAAENQGAGQAPLVNGTDGSPDSKDAPDHGPASGQSPDHQNQPDPSSSHYDS